MRLCAVLAVCISLRNTTSGWQPAAIAAPESLPPVDGASRRRFRTAQTLFPRMCLTGVELAGL